MLVATIMEMNAIVHIFLLAAIVTLRLNGSAKPKMTQKTNTENINFAT